MIEVCNPYSGLDPLCDKMIGNAFPVVKEVYDNMEYIVALGAALSASVIGQPLLAQRIVTYTGVTHATNGQAAIVAFDDVDINPALILMSSPCIVVNGVYYFPDSDVFTCTVQNDGLHITVKSGQSTTLQGATVKWTLVYGG